LIILMICAGLLSGPWLGGVGLPVSAPSQPVPFGYDVVAADVAVAAYGTFLAMPWRMLPITIAIGMFAHASRWATISLARGCRDRGARMSRGRNHRNAACRPNAAAFRGIRLRIRRFVDPRGIPVPDGR